MAPTSVTLSDLESTSVAVGERDVATKDHRQSVIYVLSNSTISDDFERSLRSFTYCEP